MEIAKLPLKKKPIKRKRVAAYARVSMDSDNLLHSLSNQVSYYTNLITCNPEWEFAGIYTDEGVSGTGIKKREEFNRMMNDARDGKIDIILTKSVSRFARNTVDLIESIRELKELDIEVRFEREHISSITGDGELLLTLLAAFAQAEVESISNNVKWAKKKKIDYGGADKNSACFGYDWDEAEGRCIINEEQARWVKYIYRAYLAGASIKGLTKDLKEKGVKGLRGNLMSRTTVRRILTSETYIGDLKLQKYFSEKPGKIKVNRGEERQVLITDAHEPIISREDFETVQKRLQRRSETCDNYGYQKSKYAGLLKCGKCGKAVNLVSGRIKDPCDRLECNQRKIGECDLLPLRTIEFEEIKGRTLRKNERLTYAVVFDDRIELHIANKEVRTAARSIEVLKALSGRIICGYCGNKFRRMNQTNGKTWCCKVRASNKAACKVRSISEVELLACAASALGHPDNLNMRIYCDIQEIEVHENIVIVRFKGGEEKTWQRK
jgi:site-specific DNA recombinase